MDEVISDEFHFDDSQILDVLQKVDTIAIVGASPNWVRPSNFVMKYLQRKNYKVIPINPSHRGSKILGEPVYGSLEEVPTEFQMVNIFRKSESVLQIIDEVIPLIDSKNINVIWMQLGVWNKHACSVAEGNGLTVIMDRCPKIEYGRLYGELGWVGVNSGIISAKKRRFRI